MQFYFLLDLDFLVGVGAHELLQLVDLELAGVEFVSLVGVGVGQCHYCRCLSHTELLEEIWIVLLPDLAKYQLVLICL